MDISGVYQSTVSELAASLGVFVEDDREVLRVVTSLSDLDPGDVWVTKNPSIKACEEALRNGCLAVFCEKSPGFEKMPMIEIEDVEYALGFLVNILYQTPSSELKVIATTGTNGKTTVSYLCAKALQYLQQESMYIGTLGYGHINHLKPQKLTTPACGELHYKLALARDEGVDVVSLEASSHGLDQGRLSGLMIDVAIFTNLTHEHMDYHKTINDYLLAKQKLMTMKSVGVAVINQDDPSGKVIMERINKPIWPVSFESVPRGYDRWSYGIVESIRLEGMQVKIVTHLDSCVIDTPLIGEFNAENLVLAHAALCQIGISPKEAAHALSTVHFIPGRMQRLEYPGLPCEVIVDYSHTPVALERVLMLLRSLVKGRLWVVFGCGGDRDQSKRPLMGRVAERFADEVIVTEDNSRRESFSQISNQIIAGMSSSKFVKVIPSRLQAIRYALREAEQNDIVVIAGKGHEVTMENQQGIKDFSDIIAIETALAE